MVQGPINILPPMKIKSLSSIMSVALLSLPAAAAEEKILASFKEAASVESWISVNDGVMGGVSKGGFKRTDAGTMVFSGDLSLENNGGFAYAIFERSELKRRSSRGLSRVQSYALCERA